MDVVRQRLSSEVREESPWAVFKDAKRLEKTGSFLKSKIGLQAYFPRSIDRMQYEVKRSEGQRPDSQTIRSPQRVSP